MRFGIQYILYFNSFFKLVFIRNQEYYKHKTTLL